MTAHDDTRGLERRVRREHAVRWAAAVVGAVTFMAGVAWIATQHWVWAWPAIVLPVVYLGLAILYRIEHRLPAWASRLLALLAQKFWTISWMSRMEDIRQSNVALLDDIDLTLREYGLGQLDPAKRRTLAATGKHLLIRIASARVAATLPGDVDAEALELLHRDRCGLITINLWQRRKQHLVAELPRVLVRSERIPLPAHGRPSTTIDDLATLLPELRDFDVEVVAGELRLLDELRERVRRYVRFLDRSGIASSSSAADFTAEQVRADIRFLPDGRSTMFRLADPDLALGLLVAADTSPPHTELGEDTLRSIHVGVFLAERETNVEPLVERLCRRVTTSPVAVPVLHAYVWKKGLLRRSPPLSDLDASWPSWVDDARTELDDYDQQLDELRGTLDGGRWPVARFGDSYVTVQVELEHEELRDVDTYLITADGSAGPVTDLVKCLKASADERPDLVALGIELEHAGRRKYRFDNFTKNTQLGVVPRGMPFHDFYEDFVHDVDVLLRHRERTLPGQHWLPDLGDMVPAGEERVIDLEEFGRSPVVFSIPQHPEPRHGKLGGLTQIDDHHAQVEWIPNRPAASTYLFDSFVYHADVDGRVQRRTVHLVINPPGASPLPASPKYVQYGEPRALILRDNRPGPSTFRIEDHDLHPELTEPIPRTDNQAISTYLARQPATAGGALAYDEFRYVAWNENGGDVTSEPIRLIVHPEGFKQISNFEITIERIDPGHCHELWFGDPQLARRQRSPSACNVWCKIQGELDPEERDDVKRVFDEIAGMSCCCGTPGS